MSPAKLWLALAVLVLFWLALYASPAPSSTSSAHLPLEARDDNLSQEEEDVISTSYVLPNQIFNDGKPYYAGKDPISGQLDFNAKKTTGIEPSANEVVDPKEKIVMTHGGPNIHDFLNLPVKYSSSKFVYPLVSSSYANLKYQGSNKNFATNKKPTSVVAPVTPAPNYHSNFYTVPTTKLMPVPPTAPGYFTTKGTTTSTSTTTTTTTTTTTKQPTTTSSTTRVPSTSAPQTTKATTMKYTTSTRKPHPPVVSTTYVPRTTPAPTRKKFMPTKKYSTTSSSSSTTSFSPSTPMRFPEESTLRNTTTTLFASTTRLPTSQSSIYPTQSSSTTTSSIKVIRPSTSHPIVFTENPLAQKPNSVPSAGVIPNLDPADVYQSLGQKNTEQKVTQKPSMSLADIFNSLADEESAVSAFNNQGSQGFDAQGNLIQPIAPSQPSPFSMQSPPTAARPTNGMPVGPTRPQFQQNNHEQSVISGSQENFSNEYVSYQVQQPSVMKYRPAPGAINNVVISPGQHSATFVLGSQQQVGSNGFGSVEKEKHFNKEPPVQYGTVINENMNIFNRPSLSPPGPSPSTSSSSPYQPKPTPGISNFHQNGNFLNSQTTFEERPAPPSPYQQLPLVSSRPTAAAQHHQQQQALALVNPAAPQQNLEKPYQQSPNKPAATVQGPQDTKELLVSTNIRFPASENESDEIPSGPVAAGPPSGPHVNGHAQPLSLQQIQHSNPVVFPKPEDEENTLTKGSVSDVQIQQHDVLTMNQHKQKLNFPTTQEQNTPSQHMEPPPRFQQTVHTDSQGRPLSPNRPHGSPPPFSYNEYTRKPIPGINRPNPDRHLPNILPQFRPNAKVSSGHPQGNFNQEPGNVRVNGPPQPPMHHMNSPQFAHRRQPLPQQKRYPVNRISEYPAGPPAQMAASEANRRVYRLPPYGGSPSQYLRRPMPMPHLVRPSDNYAIERHAHSSNPDTYKAHPQQQHLTPERMAAFEEEDLVINDPPQPVTPSKENKIVDETKLEPVVTLQMLQTLKKVGPANDDNGSGEIQVSAASENEDSSLRKDQNGPYVVYPMRAADKNGNKDSDTGSSGLSALAHVEQPPSGSEYQNTPFSVVRELPQEPILKNKKPQSLQQAAKAQPIKDKFPYPIEKPDPSFSELHQKNPVAGLLVAPRIVTGSDVQQGPIAIAYSPTEPSPYKQKAAAHNGQKYSNVNLATSVIGEIRNDATTAGSPIEEGINNDFDLRGQNLEKNFMAPFYPSLSLGTVTSAPSNGWNILPSTDNAIYEKNNIDRSDTNEPEDNVKSGTPETTPKSFELDQFQPELQGGFKPIYPPGYSLDEETDAEPMEKHESNNVLPFALPSRMQMPNQNAEMSGPATQKTTNVITTTTKPTDMNGIVAEMLIGTTTTTPTMMTTTMPTPSASTLSTTTTIPNATPVPTRKKSTFETSLAALLFGDDEDFEGREARRDDSDSKTKPSIKSKVQSGPRSNAPRMGPRSLKLR